ncbi:MAG: 6-bladed beta-propeller [Candidatus Aminicenantes bacterium]|nr:6-bladed beta-propeller [Candidatus Aminicenantes bacterium]
MKSKNTPIILLIFLLICNFLRADLIDFYKKGTIKLEASLDFGKGTDWEALFYDEKKDLVAAPDGSIFVSNFLQHNVFKFTRDGKYIKKFGRKGRGPGDLYRVGNLSILDGRYLVIGEYATARRISLFDLSGKYVKVLKTNHSVFSSVALKENKIAYLTYRYVDKNKSQLVKNIVIIIKDAETGNETVVDSIKIPALGTIVLQQTAAIMVKNNAGDVLIARTKDGNLLVGASNTPDIKIYSIKGKLLRYFHLEMKPLPVTDKYIQKYKDDFMSHVKGEDGSRPSSKWMIKKMEAFSFDKLFLEHLPYYREILVDSEGNILVFKWTDCIGDCVEIFQVYSPDGKYICETRIDKGMFDFKIDSNMKNIIFTSRGIFGLFQLKDSDDVSLRLVKVDIK